MNDAFFNDFIHAQNPIYPRVINELTQGKKRTHWMWFIFPQIKGLGYSAMAQCFALENLTQAQAYLLHEVLGVRLQECAELLLLHSDKSALEIFGTPDHLKLHSSLTLFALAANKDSVFEPLLQQFFGGKYDVRTIDILEQ
ncbi:DUF1810 domain-containing protein [Psychrobacter frigidicola]|uniref:DUF1810 domain-containing protein n=1 Tax=Psychrobacter frigidicola TaxID=45611 RepID=A0A5C7A7G3_9GAMM|nr:DUF1810 domain-containing protein [Psychrobacter frigidicola]TXD98484.1 DUF1810 domain-containing protein [Psychrobacter frigidicola]